MTEPYPDKIMSIVNATQMPHCDTAILHSPGHCEYCDAHPDWQAYRILSGISFSNHEATAFCAPCPSEWHRSKTVRDLWPGNTPEGYGPLT